MATTANRFGTFMLILIVAFIFVALLMGSATNQALQAVDFQANDHALTKHVESADIQDCLNKKGPYQVWRDQADNKTFYALCEVDSGVWGLAVCTDTGVNKTMFSPANGTREDVFSYVMRRATRFMKGLPKGCK